MTYYIQCWDPGENEGKYLKSFDPDFQPELPQPGVTGLAIWTDDLKEAMPFARVDEALEVWKKPSTRVPLRPDGKPNRPLTFFSVRCVHA